MDYMTTNLKLTFIILTSLWYKIGSYILAASYNYSISNCCLPCWSESVASMCFLIRMQIETMTTRRTKTNSTLPPTDPPTMAAAFESSAVPLVVVSSGKKNQ